MAVYTTIDNPELYFQTKIYTGDGNDNRAITFDGSENMQPNLTWFKSRSAATWHNVYDSVRGANKSLATNATNAEESRSDTMDSFDSNGFTLGNDTSQSPNGLNTNASGYTYVAWCWKETADAGFDIVSYTGDGSASTTISHSLSAVPHWIIVKNRSEATSWCVAHKSLSTDKVLRLEGTNAEGDIGDGELDSPPASSSNFAFNNGTSGTPLKVVNESSDSYIAYLWSEKQGFSKFGSYATNNNADGPYIFTGFSPAFVMLKVASGNTGGWDIYDNKRGFNPNEEVLQANASSAEASSDAIDLLSNGFKIRNTTGNQNGSGDTIIYMAFAEAPFVNSNGVPCNAR